MGADHASRFSRSELGPLSRPHKLLFNVQRDDGHTIEGYLIPDGFSDIPQVLVSDENGEIAHVPCDQLHSSVLSAGRHETGLVGFKLTGTNIPDLIHRTSLCIRDGKSELLIYRRPLQTQQINMKLVRFETQLLPHVAIDRQMSNVFQYALPSLERFGNETALQAFHLDKMNSMYLSGRLQVRNYQEFFDRGFKAIALLTDPYYEMALRIAMLKRFASIKPIFLGDRDRISLSAAIEYFGDLDIQDTSAIERALKKAPLKVRMALHSPTTRQFACSDADQPSTRRDIAAAMDAISRFEVIGHINDTLAFASSLSELLSLDMDVIPIVQRNQAINGIASELRTLAVAETYLEDDLILDFYIRQAMEISSSHEL